METPTLRDLCEQACRAPDDDVIWLPLLNLLDLPDDARPALLDVLNEGRWKRAANIAAYLRKAASRKCWMPPVMPGDGWVVDRLVARYGRTPRGGWKSLDDYEYLDDEPDELLLDADEVEVLKARARGITRAKMPADLGWPVARVESAWRRINRKRQHAKRRT
jgi:hypothetical protein